MNAREEAMQALFQAGWTLEQVGAAFSLSRERVRQILKRNGSSKEGGAAVRSAARLEDRYRKNKAARDARCQQFYGCDFETMMSLNGGDNLSRSSGLPHAFRQQRTSAHNRGISWELTFPEWVEVWQASGHINERGRGKGKYVMGRINDSGPYAKGNVKILLFESNASESYETKPSHLRRVGAVHSNPRINGIPKRFHEAYSLYQQGKPVSEIGHVMGISPRTAAEYVNNAKRVNGHFYEKYGEVA